MQDCHSMFPNSTDCHCYVLIQYFIVMKRNLSKFLYIPCVSSLEHFEASILFVMFEFSTEFKRLKHCK